MFNFTENEMKVAKILVGVCLKGMGGDRPSDLESDEYTWVSPSDLIENGYSRHEAAGYWSSLMDKGFIYEEDKNEWAVATSGWKFIDTVWEN